MRDVCLPAVRGCRRKALHGARTLAQNRRVESTTLHCAARRYLMDRFDELCRMYDKVPHERGPGWRYSRRELRIFPRYNVVAAMLVEVERLDPDHLPDVQRLAAELDRAAWVVESRSTDPPGGEVQAEVMEHERQLFSSAVETWMSIPDLEVQPLGYRRVLTPEESSDWRLRLEQRWGAQGT